MYITLESDYAIRIIQFLCRKSKRLDAKTIAENTGVSPRFSLKILRKLVEAGLVTSFKGVNGGYVLSRPAEEITLLDVIETVEGQYVFSRCLSADCQCSMGEETSAVCKAQHVFSGITNDVRRRLREVTFAELL